MDESWDRSRAKSRQAHDWQKFYFVKLRTLCVFCEHRRAKFFQQVKGYFYQSKIIYLRSKRVSSVEGYERT